MTTVNTGAPEVQGPPPPPPEASSLNKELKDKVVGGKSKEAVESGDKATIAELTREVADLKAAAVVAAAESFTKDARIAELVKQDSATPDKDPQGIEDLVDIDKNGRGHEPKQLNVSGKRSGGQFISKDNMDVIAANASDIRDNLPPQPLVETTNDTEEKDDVDATTKTAKAGTASNSSTTSTSSSTSTSSPTVSVGGPTGTNTNSSEINIHLNGGTQSQEGGNNTPSNVVHGPQDLPPVEPGPVEPGPVEPGPVEPTPVNPPATPEPGPGYRPATPEDPDLPGGMGQEPYRIDDETPTPPGPPEVLEPPQGGEPNNPAEIAFEMSTRDLDFSIEAFAVARVSREKMLSGGAEETQLRLQQQELHERHEQWSEALAEKLAYRERELDQWSATADQYIAQANNKLATLIAMRSLPADQIPPMLEADIQEQQDYIAFMNNYKDLIANEKVALHEKFEREKAEKLIEVRTRVDATMLAEREKNHPRLAKMSNWLKKHPKARLIASAGMIGLGIIGALTANPPLIGVAVAGKAALRGVGGYNAVRALGEWKVNRDLAKHGADTSIEDYTESAIKGSKDRLLSKRGGFVAGTAFAAIPLAGQLFDNTPDGPPGPPTPVPYDDMEKNWLRGIGSTRPTAAAEWTNQMHQVDTGVFSPDVLASNDVILDNLVQARSAVTAGMSNSQLGTLDQVIGRLSTTPGFGNAFTTQALPEIASQVKGGLTVDQITNVITAPQIPPMP